MPNPSFLPPETDHQRLQEIWEDSLAMQYLAPLTGNYLPWSGYALRPSGLVQILNTILIRKHLSIVECGGGVSTLYIARLFRRNGLQGRLHCIENNLDWLNFLHDALAREELTTYVQLIHAPLEPCELALDNGQWYDRQKIRHQLPASKTIDCLLVDGPPAYREDIQYSRFPAVPFFQPQLAPHSTIILDDINRRGEQEILARWQTLLNVSFDSSIGNVAIAHLSA
ncbi:sll0625 [Synechocystis sp. PCC 6803]|jgi:predicted O-methyltransferase YrrM|uniref:Sll0625 protein n=1 Tax=Synechocystis sp. (strain ATCC 27184 / PCC 6803 / Kazusa) TaxID=1111708 RepID=P74574_SYNY3|nr:MULTISPECIES: class I SAM-dependent methyltransferase [unclassified Synechocystis]BAM53456.1 hypothetical protein BEST7613_4525 [Synechocystis sp. PCC 6803] [Bacillus subtilis BEST7613]AGF53231.1 hypothetical protein MYO_130110 [Synechocystis sp. PCC 6803]ALJ69101.1 hypothetical protein AOY38_15440 [Synechocystis sp. PCC 6803]AVP90968.1 class I SAM-dependent methyltransferase [Synechocystis sp. IPPAS B-1465]MBD2618091.1 class I SAM-dependent methyltransferase [Synechocystis sp. FACHB-898]